MGPNDNANFGLIDTFDGVSKIDLAREVNYLKNV